MSSLYGECVLCDSEYTQEEQPHIMCTHCGDSVCHKCRVAFFNGHNCCTPENSMRTIRKSDWEEVKNKCLKK